MAVLRRRDPAYADRTDAGRALARALLADPRLRGDLLDWAGTAGPDDPAPPALVLALPRGGVPVAVPVVDAVRGELAALAVRRILVPHHRELAMGAVAALSGTTRTVRRADIVSRSGVSEAAFAREADQATADCLALARRYRGYRGGKPLDPAHRCVVLVDDGLATGATMTAAAGLLSGLGVRRLVVAVPVAAPSAVHSLAAAVSDVVVVCPVQPPDFRAVSEVYRDFSEPDDGEVAAALTAPPGSPGSDRAEAQQHLAEHQGRIGTDPTDQDGQRGCEDDRSPQQR